MRKMLLLLFLLSPLVLSAQESIPDLVKTFPRGKRPDQLGLNVGPEGPSIVGSASSILSDGLDFYLADTINGRILVLDSGFNTKRQIVSFDPDLTSFWMDSAYIVGGGISWGFDSFKNTFFVDRRAASSSPIVIDIKPFPISSFMTKYRYVLHIGSVLVFQDMAGKYFGVDISPVSKAELPVYLPQDAVRKRLISSEHKRFSVQNDLFFDGTQLISGPADSTYRFLASLPDFDRSENQFDPTSSLLALANGNYLYFGENDGWKYQILSDSGKILESFHVDRGVFFSDPYHHATFFQPAPDGYLYATSPGDEREEQTAIYRLGPFEELRLDFANRGAVVNDDHVNVREGPNTRASVLKQTVKGMPVRVISATAQSETIAGRTGVWYHLRFWDRSEGWVFGAFVDLSNSKGN